MLKVKIKYVTQAKLAGNATVGKKYATVTATTLVDVDPWLKAVGAVTMVYMAGGAKFLASIGFLTQAKLRSDVSIRFYNAEGKCVAKWVAEGIGGASPALSAEGNGTYCGRNVVY